LVQVVERWNPYARVRQDLFGIIDVLAVGADIVGIQATSNSNVSARVAKITESEALPILRKAGIRVLVHGWAKRKGRWTLREVDLSVKSSAEIGQATLERLRAQAAANRASGERLRAEVRAVWEQDPNCTAKEALRKLARRPLPSVRRVQELLKQLRADSTTYR